MQRRAFIKSTSLATAGITILNFPIFGKNAPSNKVVIAVMGVNSRGAYLANSFSKLQNVEVAYICDVEAKAIKNGLDALKETPRKPTIIKDIRKLVTMKEAMHKYGKLIQMGNQRRSFPTLIDAVQKVKDGIIGNAYFGKAWYTNNRKSIGYGKKVPVPPTLDFDLWQGPAPRRDYQDNLVHYNWHWFWHWGTSETCNNGTHEIDCCRWFLDVNYPTKITSSGGRYAFHDDWQTPDTQVTGFEFGNDKAITWEGRSCNIFPVEGAGRGFIIYGDKGTLVNDGNGDYKIFDEKNKLITEVKSNVKADPNNTVSASGNLDFYHFNNFIQSIRGEAKLTSPVNEGYKSILLCLLANIAQRTGKTLHIDPANGHILNDAEAMKLWSREYEKGWAPVV